MGGGIFGLSCAWEMARRGARVRLIERARIGAGASGGVVGALAPHVPENWNAKKAFQLESLLAAEQFWSDVAAAGGIDPGYRRTGRLVPVADGAARALAEARAKGARTLWKGCADWRVIPAGEAGEWAPPSAEGVLVSDTLSARIHSLRACQALAAALRAAGAELVEGDSEPEGAPVLWATGVSGLAALSADLGQSVGQGIKGQAALLDLDRRDSPQLFVDGLHIVPHADGTVAVGSTSEREFGPAEATDARLDALIDEVQRAVPPLADAPVIARWAGVRPRARSRAPMLGSWPGRPGHFVANGGFKIGFGMAPGVARVMSELVLEGRDTIPEGFRVEDSL
ncbi:MAG: FAD-binding oxidoreductase [Pseudomonadota bacterium]